MTYLLNTLYVTTEGAWLRKDHESVVVEKDNSTLLRVPLLAIGAIVCIGRVSVSPWLMHACAESDKAISFLDDSGRFLARVESAPNGNVLLRRTQFRLADDEVGKLSVVRSIVTGKLANSVFMLRRNARDAADPLKAERLSKAADGIGALVNSIPRAKTVDQLRGYEGEAGATYFSVFNDLLRSKDADLVFKGRNRRPPVDPINALLSFLYALLHNDCIWALNAVGLDPAVGFLHADRPGRLSLGLDLMEEFRSVVADRLAIKLINLGQVTRSDFITEPSGAVRLADAPRKYVIAAWQQRKQEEVSHPFTQTKLPLGLVFHLQARLLARTIRGDVEAYPPFTAH